MVAALHDSVLELPSYTPPPIASEKSEHTSSLETGKGRKWLVLKVKSRGNASSLPLYYEKDIISGRVELDLEKGETIKGVVVSVGHPLLPEPNDNSYMEFVG